MLQRISSVLAVILFFCTPVTVLGQQANVFLDRLIIKYETDQKLQQLQAKLKIDPKSAVQQILNRNGVRSERPLLSENMQQYIRQRQLPSGDDVLRIRKIEFSRNINPIQLAAKINSMPGVEYAEPQYIRKMDFTPNDPRLEKYIDAHNFTDAWDLSQGSRDIIIAINDGGVGYTHPELDDNLWVNQDEVPPTLRPQVDQNGDGTITSTEIYEYLQDNGEDYNNDGNITLEDALHENSDFTDGLDTDGNDFTDDLYGWDFWASGGNGSPISQDNNPIHDGTDHGSHVAGIAAAETNNGSGIAGAAFTASYMPVKTGGTANEPDAIGFGFDGIIYAAQNGADIINCSWGGSGASEAEQEIINLATEMGSLVVASAGNESIDQISYPAGYDKVLSIGAVQQNGTAASYTNFGYNLDVLATGNNIESTSFDQGFATKSGTSMATPVASGLAALVKDLNPNWSAERIGTQIRATASYIDDNNAERFQNKLGHGSVDAFEALDTDKPGLKVTSHKFTDGEGNKLTVGQPGEIEMSIVNVGNSTSNLVLQIQNLNNSGIDLPNSSQQLGTISTGDTVDVIFDLTITADFNLAETPTLRLNFEDSNTNYDDFRVIQYENLLYDELAANNVKTSLAADGTIGFTNPLSQSGGVGFIPRTPDGSGGYDEGDNLLFEGGLMIEINGEIFDAVREENGVSRDFIPQQVFVTEPTEDGNGIKGSARFVTDTDSSRQAVIDLETFALNESGIENIIFVKYTIQNPSSFNVLEDVYVGLFNDWDIGDNAGNNSSSFSEADSLLYLFDASQSSDQPIAAVAHMGPISGVLAIDNALEGQQDSLTFGIYDGFTDAEKSNSLKSGTVRTDIQNTDVSAVTASGPYTLNPGAQITVGFVYAFGDDTDELRNQVAQARSQNLFSVSPTGTAISEEVPNQTQLFQNYPNPFRETTRIRIDLSEATDVTLAIYDVLGRKVRTVADGQFEEGSHFIRFNGRNLSSGIYFARLITDQGTQTIPMTLIK